MAGAKIGPGMGKAGREIDTLYRNISASTKKLQSQIATTGTGPGSSTLGEPYPALAVDGTGKITLPFVIGGEYTDKGARLTFGFFVPKGIATLKMSILRDKANPKPVSPANSMQDQINLTAAHGKTLEHEWADITDEESQAGYLTRTFPHQLDFLTTYGVTRLVATVINNGLISLTKNPLTSPYRQTVGPPVVPPIQYVLTSPDGVSVSGTPAKFTTCNQDQTICPGADANITMLVPDNPFATNPKQTRKGIKPLFNFLIPSTLRKVSAEVAICTLKYDTASPPNVIDVVFDSNEILQYEWHVHAKARAAGKFAGRFGHPLDFNTLYALVRVEGQGDNVGGQGIGQIFLPGVDPGAVKNASGTIVFFNTSDLTDVLNPDLGIQDPIIGTKSGNVVNPLAGFEIRSAGVRATTNLRLPASTTEIDIHLRRRGDTAILAHKFIDVPIVNDANGNPMPTQFSVQFPHRLDFLTTYDIVRLIAKGANVGGQDLDVCKQPGFIGIWSDGNIPIDYSSPSIKEPPLQASFNTCDHDGNFGAVGGPLNLLRVASQKRKKAGVRVRLTILIPVGTDRITIKMQATADKATNTDILQDEWVDIEPDVDSLGKAISPQQVTRGFAHLLETGKEYGIVRLIGFGSGVNGTGLGGANPDIYRDPKVQPLVPHTFYDDVGHGSSTVFMNTNNALVFVATGAFSLPSDVAQIPSIPVASEITSSIGGDAAASFVDTSVRVWATNLKGLHGLFGTSIADATNGVTAGAYNWSDLGASDVQVVFNPYKLVGGVDANLDKQKHTVLISLTDVQLLLPYVDIQVPGLSFGQKYRHRNSEAINTDGFSKTKDDAVTVGAAATFRAGGEIDLALINPLSLLLTATLEDPRHSDLNLQYTEPSSNVIFKEIRFYKDIKQKQNGKFRQVVALDVKSNEDYFIPGVHDGVLRNGVSLVEPTATIQHPQAVDIRYLAEIHGYKLDGVKQNPLQIIFPAQPINQSPPIYINTTQETSATDTARPNYSGFNTYGPAPVITAGKKIAKMRVRWKPTGIKARCNLPDVNRASLKYARVFFKFTYSIQSGRAFLSTFSWWNPLTGLVGQRASFDDDNFGVDIGLAAGDFFDPDRPTTTDPGGLDPTLYAALLVSFNAGQPTYMEIEEVFFNNIGTLSVQSFPLNFPFDNTILPTALIDGFAAAGF